MIQTLWFICYVVFTTSKILVSKSFGYDTELLNGQQMCRTLLKTHIISGCDVTSKFGTKAAALKIKPEYYLLNFGKSDEMIGFQEAKKYLVQLLQKTQSVIVLESSG